MAYVAEAYRNKKKICQHYNVPNVSHVIQNDNNKTQFFKNFNRIHELVFVC